MPNKTDSHPNLISPDEIKPASLELETVRKKLAGANGPKYWRTLQELADQPALGELLQREFPRGAGEWLDPVSRRGFLKLAGASLALAGLAGCTRQPYEQILPYVRQPEYLVPGKPIFFATAMPFGGYAHPLLVETHEYRPSKIEGNPQHGACLGGTDLFAQASVLDLYDPDRSINITYKGEPRPWGEFLGSIRARVLYHNSNQGAGLRFLSGATSSPTFGSQMRAIQQVFPQSKWYRWEPAHHDSFRAGSKMAFGAYYDSIYKFDAADVVVSLDGDFLSGSWFPGFVRYARDFMTRRKDPEKGMNRLYVAESAPTTTGAKADHKIPARNAEIEQIARALAAKVGVAGGGAGQLSAEHQKWVDAAAADLIQHKGKGIVVPGVFQSPAVVALVHAMNAALGNAGQTVTYIDPVEIDPLINTDSIRELVGEINAGKVETLIILGGNPVYDAPADLDFGGVLEKFVADQKNMVLQLSIFKNETTDFATWHVPEAHYLESWGDARSFDGAVTLIQPMIAPLYDGKSANEIIAIFTDEPSSSGYDLVRAYWRSQHTGDDFEAWWRRSLHDGYIANSAFPAKQVAAKLGAVPAAPAVDPSAIEIIFRPDPTIYDGRFVNNGWLQETPKPLSRGTWDNVAYISPKMAQQFGFFVLETDGIAKSDSEPNVNADHQSDAQNVLEITIDGRKVKVPAWPQPGHPDGAVTLFLGYGRRKTGIVGTGTGYDAYSVRPVGSQYTGSGSIQVIPEHWDIAITQGHFTMDTREPVKAASLKEFLEDKHFAHDEPELEPRENESLYPDYRDKGWYKSNAWGMAIDLNSCVGCQACSVACYAENNISVVGKYQVQRGREMMWIRIDTYYAGDPANPSVYFQPLPCMQCEDAPCEGVCPVGATVHSTEGLNDMVYNRCVGTRYCSNNCPYKVRRFNFLLFADYTTPVLKLQRNPDVTVRSRGVMEKCTYCIQRITAARINAEEQGRYRDGRIDIRDGEIKTACQQACPADAIVFGDINDPNSRVAKLKSQARNYSVLAEVNTRPRTTYLAAVNNPNPELEKA
ncbi:MAG TPA: TAT-variant-translocated molybdopterin oxidoreductase [Candidatus Acidoferrales bacterium]|nr:TAT-variant-translocated molybdopterin oxidoreductase [Candidatus Acidoferrales bacterium]